MAQQPIGCDHISIDYLSGFHKVPEGLIERMNGEFRENEGKYREMARKAKEAKHTARNVRLAGSWAVATVKTDTGRIDSRTNLLFSGNFRKDKSFVENTTDGKIKWEKVHEWLTSDNAERVATALQDGRDMDAHAHLAGLSRSGPLPDMYRRTCKASLPLELLGVPGRMCIDSRRFRVLKPYLESLADGAVRKHPVTAHENPYRHNATDQNAKCLPVVSHSAQDSGKTFLEDRLARNPCEYVAITRGILLNLSAESEMPIDCVSQVLFNLGGEESTWHDGLMDRLE